MLLINLQLSQKRTNILSGCVMFWNSNAKLNCEGYWRLFINSSEVELFSFMLWLVLFCHLSLSTAESWIAFSCLRDRVLIFTNPSTHALIWVTISCKWSIVVKSYKDYYNTGCYSKRYTVMCFVKAIQPALKANNVTKVLYVFQEHIQMIS